MNETAAPRTGLTRQIAERGNSVRFDDLQARVKTIATHSILDFVGLSIASANLPLIKALIAEALDQGGREESSAVGSFTRLPAAWAASVNAGAGHVLAYDDVNMVIPGHATAVAWPSSLALAEISDASGRHVLEAYVAGFETTCVLGELLEPSHYDMGFHASGTLGAFGAAMSASRMLQLDIDTTAQALSVAATMASGLKGAFGTMLKPFQVARATGNGVLAARLAKRGLGGRDDLIEREQGFAVTHSKSALPLELPRSETGSYMLQTLYKYHAACYLAHSPIEGAALARQRPGFDPDLVQAVTVTVNPMAGKVCNIDRPKTDPEVGYSIRTLVAMSLLKMGVTRPDDLKVSRVAEGNVLPLADRVTIAFDPSLPDTASRVHLRTDRGDFEIATDVGNPEEDLSKQERQITNKVRLLAEPAIGPVKTSQLIERVLNLPDLASLRPIAEALRPST
ncbi:2-methylcitrate dehydratase PrpD [Mesorhizobium sp. J18]|uniref:MmgE/PrpD family protein n=1 Tax=Mesorhizobium sp. J18 TaxID=935263 RepID=UPI00119A2F13|nr:MmgE/PrpD family protein [Mesorhizobium sp. J18]TWG96380.1 2-methylcitrate dehydratase PrpD [Mesorhizobium sp. J18]